MCECLGCMAILTPADAGQYHHKNCPKYSTEEQPRLFYYEEALSCWCPALEHTVNICDVANLEEGEDQQIIFKRIDMTDEKFDNLEDA